MFDDPEATLDVPKTLESMKETLEQNGKPSAINLITENDNKFLRHLERQARKEALAASVEERLATGDAASEKKLDQTELTEEEKAAKAEEQKKAEES